MDKILLMSALIDKVDRLSEDESHKLVSLWEEIFGNSLGPVPKTVAELVEFCTAE